MDNREIVQALAAADPDFKAYCYVFGGLAEDRSSLSSALIDDLLALLAQEPQWAAAIDSLQNTPASTHRFAGGGEVGLLLAVAFLLRTHIRLERSASGKWKFLIEHKPGDSRLLTELLQKLEKLWA